jgi:hypothetical protein
MFESPWRWLARDKRNDGSRDVSREFDRARRGGVVIAVRGNNRVELGDRVRDRVTGFEGIAVCRVKWLFGCERIGIQPPVGDKGEYRGEAHFDVDSLDVVEAGVCAVSPLGFQPPPGGPDRGESAHARAAPPRR